MSSMADFITEVNADEGTDRNSAETSTGADDVDVPQQKKKNKKMMGRRLSSIRLYSVEGSLIRAAPEEAEVVQVYNNVT